MIDFDHWLTQLDDGEEQQEREWHTNQEELFQEYVLREETAYRKDLKERFDRGEKLTGPKGLRKKLAAVDLSYFGRAYLSHYFVRKSPEFHAELDAIWESGVLKGMNPLMDAKKISRADGSKRAIAAPRGHAKSTNFTFKDSLHAILYAYKHYLIILSDSSDQAEAFLEDIKDELEDNADIIEDFGCMKGEDTWKSGTIKTTNGVKVDAVGSGKKLRGRKNRSWRPDLIVLDDIENDENVNTPEQRKKLLNWFNKAVMKAGDTYTDIMYVGTILHYDSLLSNTLKNPEFKSRKYRAVISYADNTQLWEQWEELFVNLFDELHEEHADEFFEEHKTEMLNGTQVLWEEKLSYYKLMKMKVSEGDASFNSELQNDPIDPDNATFNEEWFDFYDDENIDFSDPRFYFVGSNDPSLGKNKKSDTSAIIGLATDMKTGYMYVVDASIEKRHPDVIIDDAIDMSRRYKKDYGRSFRKFGVETVQFQWYFKEVLAQKSAQEAFRVVGVDALHVRIKDAVSRFGLAHRQGSRLGSCEELALLIVLGEAYTVILFRLRLCGCTLHSQTVQNALCDRLCEGFLAGCIELHIIPVVDKGSLQEEILGSLSLCPVQVQKPGAGIQQPLPEAQGHYPVNDRSCDRTACIVRVDVSAHACEPSVPIRVCLGLRVEVDLNGHVIIGVGRDVSSLTLSITVFVRIVQGYAHAAADRSLHQFRQLPGIVCFLPPDAARSWVSLAVSGDQK